MKVQQDRLDCAESDGSILNCDLPECHECKYPINLCVSDCAVCETTDQPTYELKNCMNLPYLRAMMRTDDFYIAGFTLPGSRVRCVITLIVLWF